MESGKDFFQYRQDISDHDLELERLEEGVVLNKIKGLLQSLTKKFSQLPSKMEKIDSQIEILNQEFLDLENQSLSIEELIKNQNAIEAKILKLEKQQSSLGSEEGQLIDKIYDAEMNHIEAEYEEEVKEDE